jgi:hypothetical protein
MTTAPGPERFHARLLTGLDEPVQRFLTHALHEGAALGRPTRLRMTGTIKVGAWLPFTADWDGDARSFRWHARVGPRRLAPLEVVDRYADAAGVMEGRLLGRIRLFDAHDEDVMRSAAVRAALEGAYWAPGCLLPQHGVTWRAESDDVIVATWDVPPERPDVRLRIDAHGALRAGSALRWGKPGGMQEHDYVPMGGEVHAERRFGDLVVPSRITAGWFFGTPRYAPFFRAEVVDLATVG